MGEHGGTRGHPRSRGDSGAMAEWWFAGCSLQFKGGDGQEASPRHCNFSLPQSSSSASIVDRPELCASFGNSCANDVIIQSSLVLCICKVLM